MTDKPKILEIFNDYVWPWCYLSTVRIEKIKRHYDVETRYVHFPLHPETPEEGRPLEALFGTDSDGIAQKNAEMKSRMDTEGLPYGLRTHTYNSRLAQELGSWADTQVGGDAIHDGLFAAYFVESRNVADISVLVDVVECVGLDALAARDVLEHRTFKEAVDADWARSRQYGVTGVPTYVIGNAGIVGAQPYEMIEQLVREHASWGGTGEIFGEHTRAVQCDRLFRRADVQEFSLEGSFLIRS